MQLQFRKHAPKKKVKIDKSYAHKFNIVRKVAASQFKEHISWWMWLISTFSCERSASPHRDYTWNWVMDETDVMDDGWDEWGYEGEADQ